MSVQDTDQLSPDLLPEQQAELLARDPMAYATMVQSVSAFGIYLIDPSGHIISWNRGAERLTGLPAQDILGKPYETLFPADARGVGLPKQILGRTKYSGHFQDEHARAGRKGGSFMSRCTVDVVHDQQGAHTGFVEVIQDITSERQREASLFKKATRDNLTQLPNRGYFLDLARQEIARAKREHAPLSVALIDLDHFKKINDLRGHDMGDQALKHVADLMRKNARSADVLGRLGGEEFAMVLPRANLGPATLMCDRLRVTLFQSPLPANPPVKLSASIGVATLDELVSDIDTLLKLADRAMYRAKRNGRNRVEAWQE